MNKKITLSICCGTYCHIMGGADIQMPEDYLPEKVFNQMEISYTTCLGYCKNNGQKPPFIEINGIPFSEATRKKIIDQLYQITGGTKDEH